MLDITRKYESISSQALWMDVDGCPACGSLSLAAEHVIPDSAYFFGEEVIPFPPEGVSLAACGECGLHYKTRVPHPAHLSKVFARQAGKKWMEPYDFAKDLIQIQQVAGEEINDLLDVGASSGGLLKACAEAGVKGRRSALDVVPHPGVEDALSGEFIHGLLDIAPLQWSGKPYQVVTLFDVAEHLYYPRIAFENLRELVRDDGIVCIETGNIESQWPKKFGPAVWWYVRLFEHHIFWSRRSLEKIVLRHGFQVIACNETKHKSRVAIPPLRAISDLLKVGLYYASPAGYAGLAVMLGKWTKQPWSPFARDHFRIFLRKI